MNEWQLRFQIDRVDGMLERVQSTQGSDADKLPGTVAFYRERREALVRQLEALVPNGDTDEDI